MRIATIVRTVSLIMVFYQPLSAEGDNMLKTGEVAPVFTLPAANGEIVSLTDFREKKYVVLFFYPGDETPGCTKQLCAARDDYVNFEGKNAVVFGMNPGSGASHDKFIKRYNFPFPLLVDKDMKTAKAYGCSGLIVKRTVYVIDPQGVIIFAQRGMPSNEEILKAIPESKK